MRYIFLLFTLLFTLNAAVVKTPIVTYDEQNNTATISISKIDVGMSGFISHKIAPNHTSILANAVVSAFDKETQTATLQLSRFTGLKNNALPQGEWKIAIGDEAYFAFGYNRALLIAPNEEVYHQVSKSVRIQWIHPDLFATTLSFAGHPTPLKEDFGNFADGTSVGLVFIYLDQKIYMLDIKSFAILSINDAPLVQDSVKLPFYSRVDNIEEAWWGEGSDPMQSYEPHYYELLATYNKQNKKLYEIVKSFDTKYEDILNIFEIKDEL